MINKKNLKPKILITFIKFISVIFMVEIVTMVFYNVSNISLPVYYVILVDTVMLVCISFPITYFWAINPSIKKLNTALIELDSYKRAIDNHCILSISDKKGQLVYVNNLYCQISEYKEEELIGGGQRLTHKGYHGHAFWKEMYLTLASGKVWKGEVANETKNGSLYWLDTTIVPIFNEGNQAKEYLSIRTNITKIKKIQRTEQRTRLATEVSKIGIWEWNLQNNMIFFNAEMCEIYGLEPTEDKYVSYSDWRKFIFLDDLVEQEKILAKTIQNGKKSERKFRIIRKNDGKIRDIHAIETVRFNKYGKPVWLVGSNSDITETVHTQKKMKYLAMTDQLTGLANRHQFHEKFDKYLALPRNEKLMFTLMLIDLDNFKPVNDTFGHIIGDKCLKIVADVLMKNCRDKDVVARLGGDEFAILMINEYTEPDISLIAHRLIKSIATPFIIEGNEINISASIGIAESKNNSDSHYDVLMCLADEAMYNAKEQGRNRFCFSKHKSQRHLNPATKSV